VFSNVSKLAEKMIAMFDGVNAALGNVKSFFTTNNYRMLYSAGVIVLILIGMKYASRCGKAFIGTLVSACKLLASLGYTVFQKFCEAGNAVYDLIKGRHMPPESSDQGADDVTIESHADRKPSTDGLSAVLATIMTLSLPTTKFGDIGSIALAISRATALTRGMSTLKDGLAWLASKLPNEIQEYLINVGGYRIDLDAMEEEFSALLERGNSFNTRFAVDGATVFKDVSFCEQAINVYTSIQEIKHTILAECSSNSATRFVVSGVVSGMEKYVGDARNVLQGGSVRTPPVGLYFWGEAGIGKSSFIEFLAAALYPNIHPKGRSYGRNYSDAYWSRYHAQPVVFIDDYGTATDASELTQQIMQLISCVQYGLNMASVHEKGMPFNSEVVILTSNKHINSPHDGITHQPAFHRRFMSFNVVLHRIQVV
jgi:hypothetical protein